MSSEIPAKVLAETDWLHRLDGSQFRVTDTVSEHDINQLVVIGGGIQQSFVELAVAVPNDNAHFGGGELEFWFHDVAVWLTEFE